jgi:hypothetical protein
MSDSRISLRALAFVVGGVAIAIVAVLGAVTACAFYMNWSAERKANAFCDSVPIGSDISLAVERAKD